MLKRVTIFFICLLFPLNANAIDKANPAKEQEMEFKRGGVATLEEKKKMIAKLEGEVQKKKKEIRDLNARIKKIKSTIIGYESFNDSKGKAFLQNQKKMRETRRKLRKQRAMERFGQKEDGFEEE